jgi:hypothetical protein
MAKPNQYPPSWVDRLTDWIDRLPFPVWVFYVGLYSIAAVGLHVATWLNGTSPWGTPSFIQFYSAIWPPIVLYVIHDTDRLAANAVSRIAPLVRSKSGQLKILAYEITTMPSPIVLVIYLLSAAMMSLFAFQDPRFVFYEPPAGDIHPVAFALAFFFGVSSYSMAPVIVYHGIRQLGLIRKAYSLVDVVSIYHQQPLYAFSGVTMRTAGYFFLMVYISYLGEFLYDASASEAALNVVLSAIMIPISVFIVLIPLLGIHRRLADAKLDALEKNSDHIEKTQTLLHDAIDKKNYTKIKGVDGALASLYRVQDQLKTIATWPWPAGAFRNFLSAVLIPMILWLLQNLVNRLFVAY